MSKDGYVKYMVGDYIDLEKNIVMKIEKILYTNDKVYVYGAGLVSHLVLQFMELHGGMKKQLAGCLVTKRESNPGQIEGLCVYSVDTVDLTNAGVIFGLGIEYHEEVEAILEKKHCRNTLSFDAYEYNHMYWCNHHLSPSLIEKYRGYWADSEKVDENLHMWQNVLIVCIDRMGEVLLNIPLIRELHRNLNSDAKITMVVQAAPSNFIELCPYVDDIIIYDRKKYAAENTQDSILNSKRFAAENIPNKNYDAAIVTGWHNIDIEALFIAVFSGARVRVGFSEHNMYHKEFCNMYFDKFLSLPIKSTSVMHDVERSLSIVTTLGGKIASKELEIWTKAEDKSYAEQMFKENGLYGYKVIAIVAHALDSARMWDWKNYASLINEIGRIHDDAFFLLMGGTEVSSVYAKITSLHPERILNISGKTSLREAVEILRLCTLYIGANTGLVHMAAAVKLPTVEIICHSKEGDPLEYPSPERYRAWGTRSYIVRPKQALPGCGATCYKRRAHCINQISVRDVLPVVEKALADIK